jgi:nucleotide-binding universal stress UspA family protein
MLAQKKEAPFKILLADDGSEHAWAARALLGDLPFPAGSSVTVLRAYSSSQVGDLVLLEKAVNETCAQLKDSGLQAEAKLLPGSPAEKVLEYTEEHCPDLTVVGAQGLRATLGILLGGTAQQVVEYAGCPVLVVRAPYKALRHILLVTDGSESSRQAAQYLASLPLPGSARLQVMHILPPPPMRTFLPDAPYGDLLTTASETLSEAEADLRAKEEAEGQALVDRTVKSMLSAGLVARGVLRRGDAATEITQYVKQEKIDLIVTGSRGISHVRSWLLGSLTRKLVHYSGCSVLVVRGR